MNETTCKAVTVETPEFKSWIEKVIALCNAYQKEHFPNSLGDSISFTDGKRYIRVIKGTSAFAFIDKTNGDVLRPASYKIPAKRARGNIYNESNGMYDVGFYGPTYLK